jgi:hypothetical protein
MLAVWVAAAPSALAHYGDHTVGVMKVNSPGGYGTQFKIEVLQTGIDNFDINSYVRARASLRDFQNLPWLETGWVDYGCGGNCGGEFPPTVYTLKQASTENWYPSYSLTLGNLYFFKVSEADTHVDSSAYIYYNGVWQLLTSMGSPQCPCFERAGTWINMFPIGDPSLHPALSGGIDFLQGKIKKSDNQWYQWNPTNFPESSFFYTNPYVHCFETAYYAFTVKKNTC